MALKLTTHAIPAERATLWMLEKDPKTQQGRIWSRVASGVDGVIEAPMEGSIVGDCIRTGEIINIQNAYDDARFDKDVDKQTGFRTHSVLAVPVKNDEGDVIGAIQMMNKTNDNGDNVPFEAGDIKCIQMLCSHVACFIRVVHAG